MNKLFTLITVLSISLFSFAQKKIETPIKKVKSINSNKSAVTEVANTDEGYDIKLTLTPAKNQKAFLACYYGAGGSKALIDSCQLDNNCVGHFKGSKKLVGGIYFIVSQAYTIQFEVLVGDVQNFSIVADTTAKDKFVITGSPDNDLFKLYSKKSEELGKPLNAIKDKVKAAKTKEDTLKLVQEEKEINKRLDDWREEVITKNPNTLMSALLTAMRTPNAPETTDTSYDSRVAAYRFVKEHYFDDVDFNDARLLRTPFFIDKVDRYFKNYISTESDSIIPEIKYILLSARENKEMYSFLLTRFTNRYLNPEYMGQDKVFVYLFTDFYLKGDTGLLDVKSRKTIIDRGYSLMLNQVGAVAGALDLTDTTGKVISMYGLKSKYTVVVYWSPTCGHCRQEMPSLDSMYKAKWNSMDVKVYSIISNPDELSEMKKFIKEKKFTPDWYYTYETKEAKAATEKAQIPNFRQAYDFSKTPIFYLLDSEKRILGKQLTIYQIDDLITRKSKAGK